MPPGCPVVVAHDAADAQAREEQGGSRGAGPTRSTLEVSDDGGPGRDGWPCQDFPRFAGLFVEDGDLRQRRRFRERVGVRGSRGRRTRLENGEHYGQHGEQGFEILTGCKHVSRFAAIPVPTTPGLPEIIAGLCYAPLPTLAIMVFVWLSYAIWVLVQFLLCLPQWSVNVADWISGRVWRSAYREELWQRSTILKNSVRGADDNFLAVAREVRAEHQQRVFCCTLASHVREGQASEEQVVRLLEQTAWRDPVFWFECFLRPPQSLD